MMRGKLMAAALAVFLAWSAVPCEAQREPATPADGRTLELVDELKAVIQRAQRDRGADRATLNQLQDLVRRYDWPWRVKLLDDEFSDGDYTANPAWTVRRGEFQAIRGYGLRTSMGSDRSANRPSSDRDAQREQGDAASPIEGILGGILKEILKPGDTESRLRETPVTAEISTQVAMGNAFAIRVRMVAESRNAEGSRIEFGPFRGDGRDSGYRLAMESGRNPYLELLRLSPGGSSVIERYNAGGRRDEGEAMLLEWRRDSDGNMQVLLNGKPVMATLDRGISGAFDGFHIVNGGGDYTFERVEIYGMGR